MLIQRCADCATLRFPWLPRCNACGSAAWDTVEASGEGVVYSYVVMHHPRFPASDPPYAVAQIELAEGVRMVSNVIGVPCGRVRIGMPVRLEFVCCDERCDEELELPAAGDGCRRPSAPVDRGAGPRRHRRGHPVRPLLTVRLPLNTHGGQLGEVYLHGMNGIAEAVRQLRGTSVNQVAGAERVLVTAGTGVPTSGLVLGTDQ